MKSSLMHFSNTSVCWQLIAAGGENGILASFVCLAHTEKKLFPFYDLGVKRWKLARRHRKKAAFQFHCNSAQHGSLYFIYIYMAACKYYIMNKRWKATTDFQVYPHTEYYKITTQKTYIHLKFLLWSNIGKGIW